MGKAHACESFTKWSAEVEDGSRTYTVRLVTPADPRLGVDFGYSCNCPDPQHPGPCVHILIAKGYHCGWHEAYCIERQVKGGICPRCGGHTVEVPHAGE
jgi:hypothetical protein